MYVKTICFSPNSLRFSVNKYMRTQRYGKFRSMYIINFDVLSISKVLIYHIYVNNFPRIITGIMMSKVLLFYKETPCGQYVDIVFFLTFMTQIHSLWSAEIF